MTYSTNHSTISQIVEHFEVCETKFLKSLKIKVNLNEYATKLYEHSTRYEIYDITGGGGKNY